MAFARSSMGIPTRHFERYLGLTDTEASKLLESMSGSDTISVVA